MNELSNVITLKEKMDTYSRLTIHSKNAVQLHLEKKKCAYISFGNQRHYVNIIIKDDIAEDEFWLSTKVLKELHLPIFVNYEIQVDENQNEIVMGPFMGLLISEKDERITTSRLKKLMKYVSEYSILHGAVVIFALNKVDSTNRQIEGYCYNPIQNFWERGIFPYPSSIYRTIGMSKKWKNHFLSVIGDRIFNNPYFSKWTMASWFSQTPKINERIPTTMRYKSYEDVFNMLNRFNKIYIKPISGLRGQGIVQVKFEKESFVFSTREKGVNYKTILETKDEACKYIKDRFDGGKYIIQQGIELLEYDGGIIDFRCIMQKNQANCWVCKAIIGRRGKKGSIVSNISSGGSAYPAVKLLEKVISSSNGNLTSLTKENINDLPDKIAFFALDICNSLDEYGVKCGTLGVDIGVDTKGDLWLIEINNRDPDNSIAMDIGDEELYNSLITGLLLYAKCLSGF